MELHAVSPTRIPYPMVDPSIPLFEKAISNLILLRAPLPPPTGLPVGAAVWQLARRQTSATSPPASLPGRSESWRASGRRKPSKLGFLPDKPAGEQRERSAWVTPHLAAKLSVQRDKPAGAALRRTR